jgi:hypothetical protein
MPDFAQFDGFDENVDEFAMDDKAAAKAERMAEAAAVRAAFKAQSKLGVSTETHTVKEVAAHFLIWRKLKGQKAKEPVAVMATEENLKKYKRGPYEKTVAPKSSKESRVRVVPTGVSLKSRAFGLFEKGVDVKSVSAELGITYANAHYYSRAYKKLGS